MPDKPYMTIGAAYERARLAGGQLIETLNEFNDRHPDPDAAEIAEDLAYVTDDYIIQLCASTLAEAYIVIPDTEGSSSDWGYSIDDQVKRIRDRYKAQETRE